MAERPFGQGFRDWYTSARNALAAVASGTNPLAVGKGGQGPAGNLHRDWFRGAASKAEPMVGTEIARYGLSALGEANEHTSGLMEAMFGRAYDGSRGYDARDIIENSVGIAEGVDPKRPTPMSESDLGVLLEFLETMGR